jgi:hypothetical protein
MGVGADAPCIGSELCGGIAELGGGMCTCWPGGG